VNVPISICTAWRESAESRLEAKHLLIVARGGVPPDAARIIDEPLMPGLPPGHRDAERRLETNNRTKTTAHAAQGDAFLLKARRLAWIWTIVYILMIATSSREVAPYDGGVSALDTGDNTTALVTALGSIGGTTALFRNATYAEYQDGGVCRPDNPDKIWGGWGMPDVGRYTRTNFRFKSTSVSKSPTSPIGSPAPMDTALPFDDSVIHAFSLAVLFAAFGLKHAEGGARTNQISTTTASPAPWSPPLGLPTPLDAAVVSPLPLSPKGWLSLTLDTGLLFPFPTDTLNPSTFNNHVIDTVAFDKVAFDAAALGKVACDAVAFDKVAFDAAALGTVACDAVAFDIVANDSFSKAFCRENKFLTMN